MNLENYKTGSNERMEHLEQLLDRHKDRIVSLEHE